MTDPAPAAVEAWIRWHNNTTGYDTLISDAAAEALVAAMVVYAAAQRAEEREAYDTALRHAIARNHEYFPTGCSGCEDAANLLRARREGPG